MFSVTELANGDIIAMDAEVEETFSLAFFEDPKRTPFVDFSGGRITITATNGQWIYRLVGWDTRNGQINRVAMRAVLESHTVFPYEGEF